MTAGVILVIVIISIAILKTSASKKRKNNNLMRYGEAFGSLINNEKIAIGMSKEMVIAALGSPDKSDGITHKESFKKETLYFRNFTDSKQKIQFRYKVIFINEKVSEIHEQ
jgi:hypothetical protein